MPNLFSLIRHHLTPGFRAILRGDSLQWASFLAKAHPSTIRAALSRAHPPPRVYLAAALAPRLDQGLFDYITVHLPPKSIHELVARCTTSRPRKPLSYSTLVARIIGLPPAYATPSQVVRLLSDLPTDPSATLLATATPDILAAQILHYSNKPFTHHPFLPEVFHRALPMLPPSSVPLLLRSCVSSLNALEVRRTDNASLAFLAEAEQIITTLARDQSYAKALTESLYSSYASTSAEGTLDESLAHLGFTLSLVSTDSWLFFIGQPYAVEILRLLSAEDLSKIPPLFLGLGLSHGSVALQRLLLLLQDDA